MEGSSAHGEDEGEQGAGGATSACPGDGGGGAHEDGAEGRRVVEHTRCILC